jgi:large subunit ribosomal protein L27Ae
MLAKPSHSWSLVPAETREQYISGAKKDTAPVIDLLSHGYAKLLGKGKARI